MAGKESRSRGSGRGLKGETGFSGDDGRGVRGDEHEEGSSPEIGVGAAESLGRFEGRTSGSGPRGIGSAAISEGEAGESASSVTTPRRDRFGSSRATQLSMPPRPRPKPKVRSGNSSQPSYETPPSRDEEDSIFIKSGNLTTATWKQMNQIPSGVFLLNRKSFPFDAEPVHESYEDYDSVDDENPRKTTKKASGKALISKQYQPPLLSDFTSILNSVLAGSNLRKGGRKRFISTIRKRNLLRLYHPNFPQGHSAAVQGLSHLPQSLLRNRRGRREF